MRRHLATVLALSLVVVGCAGAGSGQVEEEKGPPDEYEPGQGIIENATVTYEVGGVPMEGYLAWDSSQMGNRPGVLVVHEWWGLNDYARKRARMLARLGYTALAVDMYGEGKSTEHPSEAKAFAQQTMSDPEQAEARFRAALQVLREHPTVKGADVAAVGYCFGGGVVLHMARQGIDLDGVVSFHGSLATEDPAGQGEVEAAILVLTGGADQMAPQEQVDAFRQEMEQAGAQFDVVVYEGAKHSFTNPKADAMAEKTGLPIGYDAEADRESWERMTEFLHRIFADRD